jgi:hypothetical protein
MGWSALQALQAPPVTPRIEKLGPRAAQHSRTGPVESITGTHRNLFRVAKVRRGRVQPAAGCLLPLRASFVVARFECLSLPRLVTTRVERRRLEGCFSHGTLGEVQRTRAP